MQTLGERDDPEVSDDLDGSDDTDGGDDPDGGDDLDGSDDPDGNDDLMTVTEVCYFCARKWNQNDLVG